MMIGSAPKSNLGFLIVEMLIALGLGIFLVSLTLPAFMNNLQAFETAKAIATTQENARYVMSEFSRVLRDTGFRGCNSQSINLTNATGTADYDFAYGPKGFERGADEAITGIESDDYDIKDATDAISIKRLVVINTMLAQDYNPSATTVTLNRADQLKVGDVIFVDDCKTAVMLQITALAGNQATLSQALPAQFKFKAGIPIYKFENTTFFIALSQLYVNNKGAIPNSLWRKINAQTPEELVAGIENIQLSYGIDLDDDGTPNQFLTATQVGANFNKVSMLRLKIAASSLDSLADTGVIVKPFSMSLSLRNRNE
jgi:type IV pilus assembly protein PilW